MTVATYKGSCDIGCLFLHQPIQSTAKEVRKPFRIFGTRVPLQDSGHSRPAIRIIVLEMSNSFLKFLVGISVGGSLCATKDPAKILSKRHGEILRG